MVKLNKNLMLLLFVQLKYEYLVQYTCCTRKHKKKRKENDFFVKHLGLFEIPGRSLYLSKDSETQYLPS
jgi:hypothetical protein